MADAKNTGKEYESFVQKLQQALLAAEGFPSQKNIAIEHKKIIKDNCGVDREFDLYWEYELAGITYKTVIECKDYNSAVSVEKIDALIGKLRDLPDLKGIFATKQGYQSGAIKKAEQNKIDLLIVREQNEQDWKDKHVNPYIKEVNINMYVALPPRIISFDPIIDGNWVKENTDIDTTKPLQLSEENNKIFIEDIDKNDKYSLLDLANRLPILHEDKDAVGIFEKDIKLPNAFFYSKGYRLKILSYKIKYAIAKPILVPININFAKELQGVIEYLSSKTKTSIFRDGIIRKEEI